MSADFPPRQVVLTCPVCGGDQFKHEPSSDIIECARCGRVSTKQELIEANTPSVEAAVEDMKSEMLDKMRQTLRKSLSKSKTIRIK